MAEKSFTLFHYSLLELRQRDFETAQLDRELWIRTVLSNRLTIPYRGDVELEWVPKGNLDEAIYGLLQRQVDHVLHRPPDEGGDEITRTEWQGAYVIIDPTLHDAGQRIAIENDVIGRPETLLRYLFRAINQRIDAPFVGEVEPLFDASTFWSFVDAHGEELRFIRFRFVAPNMWGSENELERELRNTRKDTGAERVDVRLTGEEGVDATSDRVSQGVAYAEKGSGRILARSKDNATYDSDDAPRKTFLEVIDDTIGVSAQYLREMKDRILGRE